MGYFTGQDRPVGCGRRHRTGRRHRSGRPGGNVWL